MERIPCWLFPGTEVEVKEIDIDIRGLKVDFPINNIDPPYVPISRDLNGIAFFILQNGFVQVNFRGNDFQFYRFIFGKERFHKECDANGTEREKIPALYCEIFNIAYSDPQWKQREINIPESDVGKSLRRYDSKYDESDGIVSPCDEQK